MVELPADIDDADAYHRLPQEYRWIMNKLAVAERTGRYCGPIGAPIELAGTYCLRPAYNFEGNGEGGVIRFEARQGEDGIEQPEHLPGWFWCEWLDGHHAWTDFTDHEPVLQIGGDEQDGFLVNEVEEITFSKIPKMFRNISKHLVIEHIGGMIIEVSPRHQVPNYDMRKIYKSRGFEWKSVAKK